MSASSPPTTSPPLAGPAIHRGLAISRLISGSLSRRPLPAYTAQTVSASAASTAPKPRGLLLRCRAAEGAVPGQVEAPLKVMISGAPASGKGTQCRMIVEKYGLVHISTGDLLRAEVSSGSDIGNKAKEYMDNGMLVPDQVVTDVPDDNLIDRCVGRRLDPVTGKIYHVKNFPPENEEISARLLTRSDDTFEKVKSRLETYKQNSEAVLPTYSDLLNQIDINIPELNPEMVCVQGSMGQGAFAGIPLQLAGTRKILEIMDWGDYGAKGAFINIGAVGASEVDKEDDMFVLIAPQNAVGNCIIDDMPASSGVMQTMGRDMRLQYAASFETCYSFRLLFYAGTFYPIMGALRMAYPNKYEIYRRVDEPNGKEKYTLLAEFTENPTADDITNAFKGPKK
ncbi:hypothetical protein ACQ4PT_071275 [Festuca glaucescens]